MGIYRTLNMFKNLKNWDSYLIYKIKKEGEKEDSFIFKLRNGFVITVPKQVIPEFKESLFEEVYFKRLSKKFNFKNPTILDIGANVGYFTICSLFKFANPKVLSFEPVKRNFSKLEHNIKAIGKISETTLVNKAVAKDVGEIVLKFNGNQAITTSASIFDNKYGSDEEIVQSTTLENIFKDYNLTQVDLLKLDCEGAEYEIFYTLPKELFDKIENIAMETHLGKGEKENNKALAGFLQNVGYTVFRKSDDLIWAHK